MFNVDDPPRQPQPRIALISLKRLLLSVLVALSLLSIPQPAFGATILVNTHDDEDNTDGDCSLREAIMASIYDSPRDACPAGNGPDVIHLSSGTYSVNSAIAISGDLEIDGSGIESTVIDANGASQIFQRSGPAASFTLKDLTLRLGNAAAGSFGGCFSQGGGYIATMRFVRFSHCVTSGRGGAISNGGDLTIEDSIFEYNTAQGLPTDSHSGGAIYMNGGNLTLTRTQFVDNTTDLVSFDGRGGAIHQGSTSGSLTITDSSFTGNQAQAGGAIMSFGTVLIRRSTFTNNSAGLGGALALGGSGTTVEILNSTFSGNDEGAIRNSGDTWILSSTFANNTTDPTLINDGTLSIKNTILQRADGGNCALPVGSAGFNIDSSDTCGLSAMGDLVDTDPMLGALQDNGGSTQTMKPQADSPAVDSGDPTGCIDHLGAALLVDQRGMPREVDGDLNGNARCDIGAVERELANIFLPLVTR